jgi:hypothetical protein
MNNLYQLAFEFVYTRITLLLRLHGYCSLFEFHPLWTTSTSSHSSCVHADYFLTRAVCLDFIISHNLYQLAFEFVYTRITLLLRLYIVVCSNFIPYEQPLYQLAFKFIACRLLSSTKTCLFEFHPLWTNLHQLAFEYELHMQITLLLGLSVWISSLMEKLYQLAFEFVYMRITLLLRLYIVVCSNFVPYEQPLYRLASEFIARRLLFVVNQDPPVWISSLMWTIVSTSSHIKSPSLWLSSLQLSSQENTTQTLLALPISEVYKVLLGQKYLYCIQTVPTFPSCSWKSALFGPVVSDLREAWQNVSTISRSKLELHKHPPGCTKTIWASGE